MRSSLISNPINWRWWFGLILTFVVIGLLVWNIILTKQLLTRIETSTSTVVGYPTKRLDDIWMRVRSIERIIHTVPLVECGDQHERKTK